MSVLPVLAAIAVLALLIVVHELGHFLAARLQGIYANRFSIGFGPVLLKYQGKETEYAIRAIPLGGFVGFPDDDPEMDIAPDDPNLLRNRPLMDRAIVISAGVMANLVFAYLILVLQIGAIGIPQFHPAAGVLVPQVISPTSAAAQAGIKNRDVVVAVNGQELGDQESAIKTLMDSIHQNAGQPLRLQIKRQDELIPIVVVPEKGEDGQGLIGVQLLPNHTITYRAPGNPLEMFTIAADNFQDIFVRIVQGFATLATNFKETASQVSGPVKIVEQGANIAQSDFGGLLWFAAFISINLAVINILPLPALDGGQLAFLAIEGLRGGKPLPVQFQESVTQTGLVLLLGLGVFLIVRDTAQLEWVQRLL